MDRVAPFFASVGAPAYDPSKAIISVHVEGAPAPVAVAGTHDMPFAWSGTAWKTSNLGLDVVFPSATPGSVMVGFQDLANGIGATMVPAVAGTITYVTLVDLRSSPRACPSTPCAHTRSSSSNGRARQRRPRICSVRRISA